MATEISRDPFARTTTYRESYIPRPNETCAFCGRVGYRGRLFHYWTEQDAINDAQETQS